MEHYVSWSTVTQFSHLHMKYVQCWIWVVGYIPLNMSDKI